MVILTFRHDVRQTSVVNVNRTVLRALYDLRAPSDAMTSQIRIMTRQSIAIILYFSPTVDAYNMIAVRNSDGDVINYADVE